CSVFKGQFGFSVPPNRLFQTAGRLTYHIICLIATVNFFRPFSRFKLSKAFETTFITLSHLLSVWQALYFSIPGDEPASAEVVIKCCIRQRK
ncbi:hypothetical protein, partial [Paenibacillus elgii]|uniref:hypothetical protein n=1 Tax=Paenibacillus elgii TaxID=189691 RepID=UPI001E29CE7A